MAGGSGCISALLGGSFGTHPGVRGGGGGEEVTLRASQSQAWPLHMLCLSMEGVIMVLKSPPIVWQGYLSIKAFKAC